MVFNDIKRKVERGACAVEEYMCHLMGVINSFMLRLKPRCFFVYIYASSYQIHVLLANFQVDRPSSLTHREYIPVLVPPRKLLARLNLKVTGVMVAVKRSKNVCLSVHN